MFRIARCAVAGCDRPATWDLTTCAGHDATPADTVRRALDHTATTRDLRSLSFAGLGLGRIDFSGRKVDYCDFCYASLEGASFAGARMRYAYFDFATMRDCDFRGADIAMCVFAGAELAGCDFSGSEIMQSNFLGASLRSVRFEDSDLYSSRFIGARFGEVDMRNCNLKEVHFDALITEAGQTPAAALAAVGVDARSSNAGDAVYGGER
jgi:uncharacterized protein YjbI with pentapeptide repeats